MNQINKVKKAEKSFLIFLFTFFSGIKRVFVSLKNVLSKIISQKITVMFIPHSEKKVFNFRINLFLVFLTPFIIAIIFLLISIFSINYVNNISKYDKATRLVQLNQKRSHDYERMINEIIENHSVFKTKLDLLLNQLDSTKIRAMKENDVYNQGVGGPVNKVDIGNMSQFEIDKLEADRIINDYQYSIQAFGELNTITNHYNKLLKDIPFGSPVKGPYAITSGFGLRIHPIYKILDMHQGLDMAGQPGTQIISTAPGVVEKVEWSPDSYGWYCKISHKVGFSTLYAHMRSRPIVNPGDKIKKGQLIGYMGSTGAATGNHLHYEVRLGNSLLDPLRFVITY